MSKFFVGTSGYSYKGWKGHFYPEDLPDAQMLRYYGEQFSTVEINNTFYRMPSETVLSRWYKEVPDGFVFVLKASRRITHQNRLKGADDSVAYLLEITSLLGDKLGPLLFQLPPYLRKDLPRLQAFLDLIPEERRVVFEFRHPSWYEDDVFDALRRHDAALCIADAGKQGDAPLVPTAAWGYVRLRRDDYTEPEFREWAEKINTLDWEEAFVFFKHEEEGIGPKLAARFNKLLAS